MLRNSFTILVMLLILFGCQKNEQLASTVAADTATHFRLDWQGLAKAMVAQMNLEPGERVMIVAQPGRFDSLVLLLEERIANKKGEYLGAASVDSSAWPANWKKEFVSKTVGMDVASMTTYFKDVDLAIMMPGATIKDAPYIAMQKVLSGGNGRTIHFHWSGAYGKDGSPLPITQVIDEHYQNAIMNTNYRAVSGLQQFFEEAARKSIVQVTTPAGTDITFSIADRPVTKQDGDASKGRTEFARNLIDREIELPSGAIRVAPIEESVEGKIAFPDGRWNNKPVTGLMLTLSKGKITNMTATSGLDAVKEELDQAGEAGYSFREFALGFNPLLAVPDSGEQWIPYYGYGAGVVRLSLGDNSELGGKVTGGYVRWNFFTDATVKIGEQAIVENGKMKH